MVGWLNENWNDRDLDGQEKHNTRARTADLRAKIKTMDLQTTKQEYIPLNYKVQWQLRDIQSDDEIEI
jgi:hypothetical protein